MSKVIRNQSGQPVQRWELPDVEHTQDLLDSEGNLLPASPITAEQIHKLQREAYQEAYDEGFAKGLSDGKQAAAEQVAQKRASLDAVLTHCARPLQQLDREVEEQLLQLVIALTRQLVRREIKTDPGQIVAVVREALQVLPVSSRDVQIFLHPDDLQTIKQVLADGDNNTYWRLTSDPSVERGDCRIQTDTSSIDATMERRLNSVIANMLGGERELDTATDKMSQDNLPQNNLSQNNSSQSSSSQGSSPQDSSPKGSSPEDFSPKGRTS